MCVDRSNHAHLIRVTIFFYLLMNFLRKIWVYYLKHKSKLFKNFKKFESLVEKECGLVIKVMRSDRKGELTSNELPKYCENHRIR